MNHSCRSTNKKTECNVQQWMTLMETLLLNQALILNISIPFNDLNGNLVNLWTHNPEFKTHLS